MKKLVSAAALAAAMIVGSSAQAAITVYTNKAAFLAAAGSTQVEDFSGAAGQYSGTYNQSYNGFTLSGNDNGNWVGVTSGTVANAGTDTSLPAQFSGNNHVVWGNIAGGTMGTMTMGFSTPTNVLGFDWFDTDVTDQYTVSLSTGDAYSGPPFTVGGQSGFWGVISDVALTYATFSNQFNGGYISDEGFDNVLTSADVPEPAMIGLFGLGALGLGMARRRKAA